MVDPNDHNKAKEHSTKWKLIKVIMKFP